MAKNNSAVIEREACDSQYKAFELCRQERGLFSKNYLGTSPLTDYQQKLYKKLFENKRVVVKSAHGLGKDYTFSEAALEAFVVDGTILGKAAADLVGQYQGACYIIVTGPTWHQVKNIFFGELRKKAAHSRANLGIDINLTSLHIDDKWDILGFSPRLSADGDPSNFQGYHAPLVIIIMTEATGISKAIFDMADGMMTSDNVYWWVYGNPTDRNTEFAKLFTKFEWTKESWDCFLSPNLIINNITSMDDIRREGAKVLEMDDEEKRSYLNQYKIAAPQLLTAQWVIEKYLSWGEESPLFQAKVLANFPEASEDTAFSISRLEQCMTPFALEEGLVAEIESENVEHIGVDIARFGSDKTVIFGLRGNKEVRKEVYVKKDTTYVAGRLQAIYTQNRVAGIASHFIVDEGAMGAGVVDNIRNNKSMQNIFCKLTAINFGANAKQQELYANAATEMFLLAAAQHKTTAGFILNNDDVLLSELAGRKFKYESGYKSQGRYILESKAEYKKRLGHSPDIADAFCLSWYGVSGGAQATATYSDKFQEAFKMDQKPISNILRQGW